MGVLFDIVGSVIFAGLLVLAINNGVADLNEATYDQTFALNTQTNIVALARIIEYDFVKIGYRVPHPKVLSADSQSIKFQADLYKDGTVRTVFYSLRTPNGTPISEVPNPQEIVLFREVTGEPAFGISTGLAKFQLTYFDSAGKQTISAGNIKSIQVRVDLRSIEPVDKGYPAVFWEKLIYPRNL